MSERIAPKLLAEFIGTYAFVFIGAGAWPDGRDRQLP
jgi:glycerol uptake facilitator-like aquaporin